MGVLGVLDWLGHFPPPSPKVLQTGTIKAGCWAWLSQHVKTLKLPSILCTILVKVRDIRWVYLLGRFLIKKKWVIFVVVVIFLSHILGEISTGQRK